MAEEIPNKPKKSDTDFQNEPQKNNPKSDDKGGCGC